MRMYCYGIYVLDQPRACVWIFILLLFFASFGSVCVCVCVMWIHQKMRKKSTHNSRMAMFAYTAWCTCDAEIFHFHTLWPRVGLRSCHILLIDAVFETTNVCLSKWKCRAARFGSCSLKCEESINKFVCRRRHRRRCCCYCCCCFSLRCCCCCFYMIIVVAAASSHAKCQWTKLIFFSLFWGHILNVCVLCILRVCVWKI